MSGANNLIFNEKVKSLIKEGKQISHFGFGESPFPVPDPFVRALRDNAHSRSYLPIQGTLELRKTLSEFHSHYDGVRLDPENQIVGPGSKELIYLTINAFNGVVLLTSPTWLTYEQQCNLAGKVPIVLKTDKNKGWKLTKQTILAGLETLPPSHRRGYKLLILVNPGNPSGTCYTAEELQEVGNSDREPKILLAPFTVSYVEEPCTCTLPALISFNSVSNFTKNIFLDFQFLYRSISCPSSSADFIQGDVQVHSPALFSIMYQLCIQFSSESCPNSCFNSIQYPP
ncbi:Aspartate aminotransferase [Armadillidium nasatum]|uniref:Aspartate aminotransferase n=1 Tax=Armadillidium nasatum TaxID=96803 RepID=A0A5N5TJS0_9CRUS|nr:Aspartate aminotransferase [Armadillidium nasatum]